MRMGGMAVAHGWDGVGVWVVTQVWQGAMKGDAKGVKDLAQAATYVTELRSCMSRQGTCDALP